MLIKYKYNSIRNSIRRIQITLNEKQVNDYKHQNDFIRSKMNIDQTLRGHVQKNSLFQFSSFLCVKMLSLKIGNLVLNESLPIYLYLEVRETAIVH